MALDRQWIQDSSVSSQFIGDNYFGVRLSLAVNCSAFATESHLVDTQTTAARSRCRRGADAVIAAAPGPRGSAVSSSQGHSARNERRGLLQKAGVLRLLWSNRLFKKSLGTHHFILAKVRNMSPSRNNTSCVLCERFTCLFHIMDRQS